MNFLIVDDELLIRKSLVRAFQSQGHQCDEAQNGVEAL
jgi:DNA-binding response OmpR family regulator